MEAKEARRVIRDQERAGRERLLPQLAQLGLEAEAIAEKLLKPWRGREYGPPSRRNPADRCLKPGARRALEEAFGWAEEAVRWLTALVGDVDGFDRQGPQGFPTFFGIDCRGAGNRLESAYEDFAAAAAKLKKFSPGWPLLNVPDETHPPTCRSQDIARQVDAGRCLTTSQSPRQIHTWYEQTAEILENHPEAADGFARLAPGDRALGSVFPDPIRLHQAYLALGLAYLIEMGHLT